MYFYIAYDNVLLLQFTCRFIKLHSGPVRSTEWGRDTEGMSKSSWRNSLCLLWSSVKRLISWACSSANEEFLTHTHTHIQIYGLKYKKTVHSKQNFWSESSTSWPKNSQFPVLLSWLPVVVIYPAVSSL